MALALAQGPLTERATGVAMFAPVIAAVFSSVDLATGPVALGAGVAGGYVFVQAVTLMMRLPRSPSPVTRALAWRHAVVFALLAGPAVIVTRSLGLGTATGSC